MSVRERQATVLDFFNRQQTQHRVSHAYLLVGANDTYETAMVMAQALFCKEQEVGSCGHCAQCERVLNHEHGDFAFISGKDAIIKKEAIQGIKEKFIQTSFEESQYKVYIIEDVDNASLSALNSFLKFLEEPDSNIVAILCTSNPSKVLETIKSRCLILNLAMLNRDIFKNVLVETGFDNYEAKVLSNLANSVEEAEQISKSVLFHKVLDTFQEMKQHYHAKQFEEAGIMLQVEGIKNHKFDLKAIEWLCVLHEIEYAFHISDQQHQISFDDIFLLKTATKIKDRIRPGVITSMLIDQFAYELVKGA